MAKTEREKIIIVAPNAGDDAALLRHGGTVIDLRKVQEAIDGRRLHELTWTRLTMAMGEGLTILGKPAGWPQLGHQLREPFAHAQGKVTLDLTNQERISIDNGRPLRGLAEVVIQHFDPENTHPEFQAVLRNAEALSMTKSANQKATVAHNADGEIVAKNADGEAVGDEGAEDMPEVGQHAAAIAEIRAQAEAERVAEHAAASGRFGATFIGSAGDTHRAAHAAGRRVAQASSGNPYDGLLDVVDAARRAKGWQARAERPRVDDSPCIDR